MPPNVWMSGSLDYFMTRYSIAIGVYIACLLLCRDKKVLRRVVALYVGPAISFFHTYHEAKARRGDVRALQAENARLRVRRQALKDPRTLEREARRLGLVKPGERPFIVKGLPGDK